MVVQDHRC